MLNTSRQSQFQQSQKVTTCYKNKNILTNKVKWTLFRIMHLVKIRYTKLRNGILLLHPWRLLLSRASSIFNYTHLFPFPNVTFSSYLIIPSIFDSVAFSGEFQAVEKSRVRPPHSTLFSRWNHKRKNQLWTEFFGNFEIYL